MFKMSYLVVIFITGWVSSAEMGFQALYLGPRRTKKFFFPWMVALHWMNETHTEFFCSGSLFTPKYVLSSMDCFIRNDPGGDPLYLGVEKIFIVAGGHWAMPIRGGAPKDSKSFPPWLQVKKVANVIMFTSPDTVKSLGYAVFFPSGWIPHKINDYKRSPFGFSMSVALVEATSFWTGGRDRFEYKRNILPVPIFAGNGVAKDVAAELKAQLKKLEGDPSSWRCHLGGWLQNEWRIQDYEVAYIPFDECANIYCEYDRRACFEWPYAGVHACFKSLTFAEPCWHDLGSALYCDQFNESVVAILTSTPTCGFKGLPGVFTLINFGMQLLDMLPESLGHNTKYQPLSKAELKKYVPPPDSRLVPANKR